MRKGEYFFLRSKLQMQNTESDPQSSTPPSLGAAIADLLSSESAEGPSIGEISAAVREKGFGLVLMVLALPSALPVPAPGYSTPFGIVIALIAGQMLMGRSTLWLPQRLEGIRLNPRATRAMLTTASKFLRRIEHWVRPRQQWIRSTGGQAGLAVIILCMASLMILPIPLTNTAPAMVIFLIGVGLSEEDGLLALGAFALGSLALLLYAGVVYLLLTEGPGAVDVLIEELRGLLSASEAPAGSE
jgi:hypothetical protein